MCIYLKDVIDRGNGSLRTKICKGPRWPRGRSGRVQGARWPSGVERWLGLVTRWSCLGSNPNEVTLLRNFGNSVYTALCLLEETLKAFGHFYLVSMPGEVKDPTRMHWNVTVVDSTNHSNPPPPLWHWRNALRACIGPCQL